MGKSFKRPYSFSATPEQWENLNNFVKKNNNFEDVSAVINLAIDKFLELEKQTLAIEFITHIGVSLFLFLAGMGLTLYFPSIIFYTITVFAGVYLVTSFWLFYNKYKGVKWQ